MEQIMNDRFDKLEGIILSMNQGVNEKLDNITERLERAETLLVSGLGLFGDMKMTLDTKIRTKIDAILIDVIEVKETQMRHENVLESISSKSVSNELDIQEIKRRLI